MHFEIRYHSVVSCFSKQVINIFNPKMTIMGLERNSIKLKWGEGGFYLKNQSAVGRIV